MSICKISKVTGLLAITLAIKGKNFMTLRFLRSFHFADNQKVHKSDKAYKLRPVMDNLNTAYQAVMSNTDKQANT